MGWNLFKSIAEAEEYSKRARAARAKVVHSPELDSPGDRKQLDELHTRQQKLVHRMKPPTETEECRAFVDWSKLVYYRGRPLFDRLAKIPNDRGKRSIFTAVMVAIGLRRGFPDYVILAPLFDGPRLFAGLFLEAKRTHGSKVDPDQEYWRSALIEFGYHAEICAGSTQMIAAVREYMKNAPPGAWVDPTRGSM